MSSYTAVDRQLILHFKVDNVYYNIIIIVYMYLIGNGIVIWRVYVWYRDLVVSLALECT